MKSQAYIVILAVVGFLVLAGLGQIFAAEAPAAPPLPKVTKEDGRQYNHFLFVRHNPEGNVAKTDTLVMAKVTPEGFELKDLYTKDNLNVGLRPLCVAGGKIYLLKMDDLISIDVVSGECRQIALAVGPHCFDSGRLYFFAGRPDEYNLCVYDFHKGAYLDIMSIPSPDYYWNSPIALSPDHRRLAYFEMDFSKGMAFFLLNVVDIEAKTTERPCQPFQYFSAGESAEPPPVVWLDAQTILFVRLTRNRRANLTTTANILTGEMKDIATLPGEPGMLWVHLLPRRKDTAVHLILYDRYYGLYEEYPARGYYRPGRYRIDLQAGKLFEDDNIGGDYRLSDVEGAEGLYHGARLIEERKGVTQVAVSPDGKRIIWKYIYDCGRQLRHYDTESQTVRTVVEAWLGKPFFWFAEQGLAPLPKAAEIPPGWTPFPSQPWPPPRPPDTRKDINKFLTLRLSSDRRRYQLHEPVEITLAVTNKSDIDFEIHPPSFEFGSVELLMDYPGGGRAISNTHRREKLEKVVLKAGATIKRMESLEVAYIGEYQIGGEFIGTKRPLKSQLRLRGRLKAIPFSLSVESSPDAEGLFESKMKRLLARVREEYSRARDPDDFSKFSPVFTMTSTLYVIIEIGPEAARYLISAIKEEKDKRFILVLYKPLVRIASPEALPFYRESLISGDAALRHLACLGLFELHRRGTSVADEALQVLLDALGSDDVDVRRTAAKLLIRVYDDRVKRRFEAAVEDDDETVSTAAARYLAAYEGLALAEWLARAREEPTHARYLAAKSIIKELEDDWHMEKGDLPPAPWSDVSKSPEMLAQFRQTLLAWLEWARENPRVSSRFFFNRVRWAWSKPAAN